MSNQIQTRLRSNGRVVIIYLLLAGLVAWALLGSPSGCPGNSKPVSDQTRVMGTYAHITIVPTANMTCTAAEAMERAMKALHHVDARMSSHVSESDIGRLNASASSWVSVHPQTWSVLQNAMRFHRLSDGAFDITVRPLFSLYVYDADAGTTRTLPDAQAVADKLAYVGSDKLEFRREGMRVRFAREGMSLGLGAIAKGYAVDQAMEALLAVGVQNALVEAGGEVRLVGHVPLPANMKQELGTREGGEAGTTVQPQTRPWRTGIRHPRHPGELLETIQRTNCAIATSGDYEKFFEIDGVRYSHILDPRTGYPVAGGVVSATILSPRSCMEADALATSVSVLGEEKGRKLLSLFPGVEAWLVVEGEDKRLQVKHFSISDEGLPPDLSVGESAVQ